MFMRSFLQVFPQLKPVCTRSLLLALTLTALSGCNPELARLLISNGTLPVNSSGQSTASPSASASSSPSATASPTTLPGSSVPVSQDPLLYLNMESTPANLTFKGQPVESKGIIPNPQGRFGQAWRFDGEGSYLKIPLDINPGKYPQLTMTAWARYTGPDSDGPFQVISHDDGGYDRSLGIDARGEGGRGWSAFAGSSGVFGFKQAVVRNEWTFLASVYDQQAKTVTLYVNGEKKQISNAELGDGLTYLNIGANPSYGENFIGDIDDVHVYGRALSASDIQDIYAGKVTESPPSAPVSPELGLLLYLNMDKLPTEYQYNGAAVTFKGVTRNPQGKVGPAWRFDGEASYLKIPLDINPGKYPQLTMTAWAQYTGPDSDGPFQVISHDDGGYDRSMGIDARGEGGRSWSSFVGTAGVLGSRQAVVKDQWVFLATVYNQLEKTATLYVNGVKQQVSPTESGDGLTYLNIGANPSYGENFIGNIDEVRIYGRALSAAEIQGLGSF